MCAPRQPRCCGALQLHTGRRRRRAARRAETIAAFEGCETVVVNAAGCGSAMKDYGHLLRDDPEWAERAAAFSAKVRDVNEFLAEHEPQAPRHPVDLDVAYHDACHLAHAQGVRAQPRALLRAIPGLERRRARRVGAVLRLGRRLQPAEARARRRARPAQGRATCSPPARRPSPPPTPAARCRSPPTRGRCPSITRWRSCTPRSDGRTAMTVDSLADPPRRRARRAHRRGAGLRRRRCTGASSRAARELLDAPRASAQARLAAGETLDFLPRRARSARATGRSRRRPPTLQNRRVEITGPADRKMMINALNSGATRLHGRLRGLALADVEQRRRRARSTSPTRSRARSSSPATTAASTRSTTRSRRCSCARAAGTCSRSTCASTASRSRAPSSTPGSTSSATPGACSTRASGPFFYLPKMESPPRGAAVERRLHVRRGASSASTAARSRRPCSSRRCPPPSRWRRSSTSCATTPLG